MGIVLDSCVLIAAERRRFDFSKFLTSHLADQFYIAAITASELLHGCARAQTIETKSRRAQFVEEVLKDYAVVPFALSEAREHARIWVELETRGTPIGERDLQIAATAKANGHRIATLNTGEFGRVSGLTLLSLDAFVLTPK